MGRGVTKKVKQGSMGVPTVGQLGKWKKSDEWMGGQQSIVERAERAEAKSSPVVPPNVNPCK